MVTIGIPVYNCPQQLIFQCINSVLLQTIDDIEVLIINDCCTDDTMDYVSKCIHSYSGNKILRVINHKTNTGIAGARNTILKEAKGKYIYFMDCDDYINNDTIDTLLSKAEKHNADAVWGDVMTHEMSNNTKRIYNENPDMLFIGKGKLAEYAFADSRVHLLNAVWNILIRTSFILENNLYFETECGACDDYVFTFKMIPLVVNAVLVHEVTYFWVIREGSQSNPIETIISSKPLRKAIVANNIIKNFCKEYRQCPFYEGYSLRVQKESFFNAHAIVRLRKKLDSSISNREIKDSIRPVDTFYNICNYKNLRKENLVLFFFAKLPSIIIPYALKLLYRIR